MQELLYIESNANVPRNVASATARKGDKWFNQVNVGDVVWLKTTESGRVFGKAVVVAKLLTTYGEVIKNAAINHVGVRNAAVANFDAGAALATELTAAYGESKPEEVFSSITILPINE